VAIAAGIVEAVGGWTYWTLVRDPKSPPCKSSVRSKNGVSSSWILSNQLGGIGWSTNTRIFSVIRDRLMDMNTV
jgi:hypothetical protein